jgi:hypothetical protein
MSLHRLHQRLRESGRCLRAGDYARLARYWNAGVRPEEEDLVERLFCKLVDQERAAGASLEAILSQLPREMDVAIRRALPGILAEKASRSPAACESTPRNAVVAIQDLRTL